MPSLLPSLVLRAFRFWLLAALAIAAAASAHAQQAQTARIFFEAKMTETGEALDSGVQWRVFSSRPGPDGKLPLLAQAEGGVKGFEISPGEYLIHAAYGHAGAVRRIVVDASGEQRETFTLNAGGLQLYGNTTTGARIPPNLLRFDVYAAEEDDRGVRQLIVPNLKPGEIVPFPAGTYHVVSQFGRLNAEVRADLRVEAGKLTQATIEHRAARMTFRLVKNEGGDAIADTSWSILTESGDVITESVSAFPVFVLSEGNYTAIARNTEKIYSRDFRVLSGVNQDIELLAD